MLWIKTLLLTNQADLSSLNTFGVPATADYLLNLNQLDQTDQFLELISNHRQHLILGGGSNLLFFGHIPFLICKINLSGFHYHDEDANSILLTAAAGENWHDLVMQSLRDGYAGLENLALIPGTVGAAPIQNIGAYGVELQQRLEGVEALDLKEHKVVHFSNNDCQFAYRDSLFKQQLGRYLILSVTLRLLKKPALVLNYQPLKEEFSNKSIEKVTAIEVANAVIKVRQLKLPDPEQLGNAGSFFKNPVVSQQQLEELKTKFPKIISYEMGAGQAKLAAGWLIDNLGLKGYREGDAGIHQHQALVLVNYGNATGEQIYSLSEKVKQSVFETYGVELEREVRVISGAAF